MSDEFSLVFNYIKLHNDELEGSVSTLDISGEYAKTILPHFGLSIGDNYQFINSNEFGNQAGFGNLEVGIKYQFLTDPVHETVLSVGADAEIQGTGSNQIAGEDFSIITPAFFFGKGFGDLNSLAFLKPFVITGQVGLSIPTKNSAGKSLEWGFALEYSLQYLESYIEYIGLGGPFNRMTILVEFPLETQFNGNKETTGYISPGAVWLGKYFQAGFEVEFPINEQTGNNIGIVGIFHFFVDDIFPKNLGKPIF